MRPRSRLVGLIILELPLGDSGVPFKVMTMSIMEKVSQRDYRTSSVILKAAQLFV